jgi:uncharacterized protein YhjY with autotransporter beta-barrel domain
VHVTLVRDVPFTGPYEVQVSLSTTSLAAIQKAKGHWGRNTASLGLEVRTELTRVVSASQKKPCTEPEDWLG